MATVNHASARDVNTCAAARCRVADVASGDCSSCSSSPQSQLQWAHWRSAERCGAAPDSDKARPLHHRASSTWRPTHLCSLPPHLPLARPTVLRKTRGGGGRADRYSELPTVDQSYRRMHELIRAEPICRRRHRRSRRRHGRCQRCQPQQQTAAEANH